MLAGGAAVAAENNQMARIYPTRPALAAIGCPVTILEGTITERTFVEVNRYLERPLPRAGRVEIEGGAHAIHLDRRRSSGTP